MNKLIKELVAKAQESYKYSDVDGDNNRGTRLNEEKFAELIIKECLMEVWYDATPKQISNNIKSKFGIKE